MTILDQIIAHKRLEVAARKQTISLAALEQSALFAAPRKSFADEIKRADKSGIIAEFKRRSPSKGIINDRFSAVEIAVSYEKAGASALSILTDTEFFGGSNADVETASSQISIPILRKDFIIDEFQIIEARAIGADAILLIAAVLSELEIKKFAAFAVSHDLQVLLEVHSFEEVPPDLTNISAVGVNNRDLRDFSVDVNRSFEIAHKLPPEIVKISESGLRDAATILELKNAGFHGFLIGETFMRTENPGDACAALIWELQ